jgi:hypothetical protein
MKDNQDVICFQCGQTVQDPPVLSRTTDDEFCTACSDRVLAAQAPIFPAYGHVAAAPEELPVEHAQESKVRTSKDDDYPDMGA